MKSDTNPKYKLHARRGQIHDIPPDEVEELDAILQKDRKKMEMPMEPAMPRVARKRALTAKT